MNNLFLIIADKAIGQLVAIILHHDIRIGLRFCAISESVISKINIKFAFSIAAAYLKCFDYYQFILSKKTIEK